MLKRKSVSRSRQGSNLRSQRESDFKSDALTTRPRLPVLRPPAHPKITSQYRTNSRLIQKILSEVGFEPTPTEVDCDLNAAP